MTANLPDDMQSRMYEDAWGRYQEQVALVKALRAKWVRLKKPLTALGGATGRADVIHPLVAEIQDAEMRADRLLKSCLEKRKVGRPRGAASAPDRQQQPSMRIRRVK